MNRLKRKAPQAFVFLVSLAAATIMSAGTAIAAEGTWVDAATIRVGGATFTDNKLNDGRSYFKGGQTGCNDEITNLKPDSTSGTIYYRHKEPTNEKICIEGGNEPITLGAADKASVYFTQEGENTLKPTFKQYSFTTGGTARQEIGDEPFKRSGDRYIQTNSGTCHSFVDISGGNVTFTPQKEVFTGTSKQCRAGNPRTVLISNPAADPSTPGGGTNSTVAGSGGAGDPCKKIKGFAYIFCPILNGINELITESFKPGGFVNKELTTSPLSTSSEGGATLKRVWEKMRDLTNLFFVLIFLTVVFANIASINIDAYTVKKALPRLVAAVLLVQFSYVICSLVIDVGNILGRGIYDLLTFTGLGGEQGNSAGVGQIISVGILAGAAAIITGLGAWLLMVPLIMSVVISIVMVIITLAVRHFMINVLVVLSPIAFAAWVLPNTERWFREWWQNFTRLIMMYPFIILLMAIASIMTTFGGLIGLLAPIIAFAAVPATFKAASKVLEKGVGLTRGRVDGAGGFITGKMRQGEGYKNAQLNVKSSRLGAVNKIASMGEGKGRLGRIGATIAARGTSGLLGAPGSSTGAAARQRDLQTTMKGQREQLDLIGANSPDDLDDIILGDEKHADGRTGVERLKSRGRQDLVKFAGNDSARLAAMQKKGEVFGLDANDVIAISTMTKSGSLRKRYWNTVNSGNARSKTASTSPSLVTRTFRDDGHFTPVNITDAQNRLTIDNVAGITDMDKLDEMIVDGILDPAFASRVLVSQAANNKMSTQTRSKLTSLVAGGHVDQRKPEKRAAQLKMNSI